MAASVRGHKDVVDALLRHGANVDQQNFDGHTALMFAYNGRNQVTNIEAGCRDRFARVLRERRSGSGASVVNANHLIHTQILFDTLSKLHGPTF